MRLVQALLAAAHRRRASALEVPVLRPVRGFIPVVLRDTLEPLAVAAEVHSQLRRVEEQLRWAQEKAEGLQSIDGPNRPLRIGRLLVLRSTREMRELVRSHPHVFRTAYPARVADVYASVVHGSPWPGDGILWARVERGAAALLAAPPRGVAVGR